MQKKYVWVIGAALMLGIGYAGYYTISPVFRTVPVYDEAPVQEVTAPGGKTVSEQQRIPEVPVVGTPGHPASGMLKVLRDGEKTVVRYENYKTINGPDLFVYLSKDLDATEFVNLGELRGTEGNINYEVPDGTDTGDYRYVLTWCKQFGVLFNYAELPQIVKEEVTSDASKEPMKNDTSNIQEEGSTQSFAPAEPSAPVVRTALLANGCFWCVEHDLREVPGVLDAVSGYAGGTTKNPTYENYAKGGHREVVLVTYDASKVTYGNLVEHILKHGDPTDAGGSFGDRGSEYAPAIYYESDPEAKEARRIISAVDAIGVFSGPLPIAVIPRVEFFPAEEYHQNYGDKNPIRYNVYRTASGRDAFIKKHWGERRDAFEIPPPANDGSAWESYVKPSDSIVRAKLTALEYEVTQEEGTERAGTSPYDKLYDDGVYVDILSGEPLFSSRDKYDSGTGWPSFTRPIEDGAVTLHEDRKLFTTRTEVRSRYADSHLGHVFDDGPEDRGGKRYCMNGVALRFVPKADMEREGYGHLLGLF